MITADKLCHFIVALLILRLCGTTALFIITKAAEVLRTEPNLLEVEAPITGMSTILDFSLIVLAEIW